MTTGNQLRAEVDLQAAGLEATGTAEGPSRSGGDLQLVAQATLAAVETLVDESLGLELAELRTSGSGRRRGPGGGRDWCRAAAASSSTGPAKPGPNRIRRWSTPCSTP